MPYGQTRLVNSDWVFETTFIPESLGNTLTRKQADRTPPRSFHCSANDFLAVGHQGPNMEGAPQKRTWLAPEARMRRLSVHGKSPEAAFPAASRTSEAALSAKSTPKVQKVSILPAPPGMTSSPRLSLCAFQTSTQYV